MKKRKRVAFRLMNLRIMIWIAFLLGLSLIMISMGLFLLGVRTLEALGLGALGVGDWVAFFVYKPMDRHRRVVSGIKTILENY